MARCAPDMTIIKTRRLTLRPIEKADAARFAVLCNDEDIARNTARIPYPYTRQDADVFVDQLIRARINGDEHAFAVCRNAEIIACAGALQTDTSTWEIGYWVGADYRRQGVASEAADAITQFAIRALGAETVTAGYFADNPASGRVLEKVGFHYAGERAMMHSRGRGEEIEAVRLMLNVIDFAGAPDVEIDRQE